MGLFSFLSKNKQDRTAGAPAVEDSGRFTRAEDEAIGERARAKRASHNADGGRRRSATDPVLPEKKRARRRLVGAIALALAAAVGLPMLLDSEPKPLAGDIAIQIPSKEKAAPLPMPSDPVSAADSVDTGEEIVEPSDTPSNPRGVASVDTTPAAAAKTPPAKLEVAKATDPAKLERVAQDPVVREPVVREPVKHEPVKPEPVKHEPVKHEPVKHEPVKHEPKAAPKPEPKLADAKPTEKATPKTPAKPPAAEPSVARHEDKPAPRAKPGNDDSRALSILEDKQAAKEARQEAAASTQRFVVQVAALASQEKVTELQSRLKGAGIQTFTQKQTTPSGALIRVRAGPVNKDDAEKLRARLQGLGLSGTLVPL
jgi:DedD protein